MWGNTLEGKAARGRGGREMKGTCGDTVKPAACMGRCCRACHVPCQAGGTAGLSQYMAFSILLSSGNGKAL